MNRILLFERIKGMLRTFAWVTTFVSFGTSIYVSVFWSVNESVRISILWEILGVSFLTSLGNFFYPFKEASAKRIKMTMLAQYAYINVVVLVCGYLFQWFDIHKTPMVIGMIVMIAVIFFIVTKIINCRDEKLAMSINEKLEKLNGNEE